MDRLCHLAMLIHQLALPVEKQSSAVQRTARLFDNSHMKEDAVCLGCFAKPIEGGRGNLDGRINVLGIPLAS